MSEKKNWKKTSGIDDAEILGFWNREGVLTGKLKGHSRKGMSGFYIIELTEGTATVISDKAKKPIKAKVGDTVAVTASDIIKRALDGYNKGTEVRITSRGKIDHPTTPGHSIWDMDVEVNEPF
jgi:hypothetical protein